MDLTNRSFLKLLDYTPEEIEGLLDLAADLKAKKKAGIRHDALRGKNIALIFEKTSTRTRCSFEVAAHDLGMEVTYLDPSGSQIGKKESIADTARVLGRMFDGIEYRGYGQSIVEELARCAGVPVWNGLTNEFHPTQILADFLTIREHFGHLKGINFVYFGDARYNMGNSLMVGCAKMGLNFTACAPKKYQPVRSAIDQADSLQSAEYPMDEWDKMLTLLDKAKQALASDPSTQNEVDAPQRALSLQLAQLAVDRQSGDGGNPGGGDQTGDGDQTSDGNQSGNGDQTGDGGQQQSSTADDNSSELSSTGSSVTPMVLSAIALMLAGISVIRIRRSSR